MSEKQFSYGFQLN